MTETVVTAGHSRSKNGVASLAYVPAIHVFFDLPHPEEPRTDLGFTRDRHC
jgi:hypothetical protein